MSTISRITGYLWGLRDFRGRQLVYYEYRDHFKNRLILHGRDPEKKMPGEDEYMRYWHRLCPRIEPYSYRFFSQYRGYCPTIVPEDIGRTYIEYYLNPLEYRAFYSDKNCYQQYISPATLFPKVFYRRVMRGCIMDEKFIRTDKLSFQSNAAEFASAMVVDKAVLKPSNNSDGGFDVMCITRGDDGLFYSDKGNLIDGNFLYKYSSDWIIQEVISQHPFFNIFSNTSLNTIRLFVYRSVVDDEIMIYSASLRIGHRGSFIDNLTQGGGFIKIDLQTGQLIGRIMDEEGFDYDTINDVDFSIDYFIPNWATIKETAVMISRQIRHCHMIALDLCMDDENRIRMIEHNIGNNSSYWWASFMGEQPFGDRIDEVIDYCIKCKQTDSRFRYYDR